LIAIKLLFVSVFIRDLFSVVYLHGLASILLGEEGWKFISLLEGKLVLKGKIL
jgi:hypothetical protein